MLERLNVEDQETMTERSEIFHKKEISNYFKTPFHNYLFTKYYI